MAVHLTSYLNEQFTPGVIDQLSEQLGESPEATRKAAMGSIPAILGSLAQKVQSGGASSIIGMLDKADFSNTPLEVSQATDTGRVAETAAESNDFLKDLFGEKLGSTTQLITTYSGAKPESVQTIMGLAGTILMGVLGRQDQENGLTADSLKTLLMGQVKDIINALPSGLGGVSSLLGFSSFEIPEGPRTQVQGEDNYSGTVLNPNIPKSTEGDRIKANNRWLIWAFVLIGVLVVALLVQKCREPQNSIDGVETDTTSRIESNAAEDRSATTRENVRESHGQVSDSTATGPLGIKK